MAFKYQRRDADKWEKRQHQQGGDFLGIIDGDYKTFTPAKGDNFVRIMPPTWDDAEHYGIDVYVHYGIGPDRGSVICLAKMKGEKCPICEARARAERAGDEELAKELKPNKRVLVWVLNRKDEKEGPMVWAMPWSLDRDITKICKDPRTGELYMIDDPEGGYDLSFEKTGDGIGTKYVGLQIARRSSSVDQDFLDYIVECPLPTTLTYLDYDDIQKLFEGAGAAPREEQEERRPPRDEQRRDEPRDDPKPNGGGAFRPRGTRAAEAPREDPRDPGPREEDYGAAGGDVEEDVRTAERATRAEPKPETRREEPAADANPSGKTKAQLLKEKFGRK